MGQYRVRWEEVRRDLPIWLVLAGSLVLGAWAYPRLPERVPIHWDLQGQPDNFGSPFTLALAIPLLNVAIYLLMLVAPLIDPKRANYARFPGVYRGLRNLTVLVLAVSHAAALAYALGYPVDIGLIVAVAVGVLFVYIGNSLPRVRFNYFVGIRTPWTLANERVWQRTHRLAGRLFTVAGLLPLLVVPFSRPAAFWILIGGVLAAVVATTTYSAILYRRLAD